jgi:hypothetical protein
VEEAYSKDALKPMALNSSSPKTPSPGSDRAVVPTDAPYTPPYVKMPTTKAIGKTKAKCTKCIWKSILQIKKKDEDNPLEKNRFLHIEKIAKKCTLCLIESNLALQKNVKFICRVIPTMTQTILTFAWERLHPL